MVHCTMRSNVVECGPTLSVTNTLASMGQRRHPTLSLSHLPRLLSHVGDCGNRPIAQLTIVLGLLIFVHSDRLECTH